MIRHRALLSAIIAAVLVVGAAPTVSSAAPASTITLSGHISLGISSASAGLNEVGVAYRVWQPQWFTSSVLTKTDASGNYQITIPVSSPAVLALKFVYLGNGNFVDGTTSTSTDPSDPVLQYTGDTTGVDFTLAFGAEISGIITDSAEVPQLGVTAVAVRTGSTSGERSYSANSDVDGHYTITGLPEGEYRVKFIDNRMSGPGPNAQKFSVQWWQSTALNRPGAPPFSLATGQSVSDVSMSLTRPSYEQIRISCLYCDAQLAWNTPVFYKLELEISPNTWASAGVDQYFLPTLVAQFRDLYPGNYRLNIKIDNPRYLEVLTPEFTLNEGDVHYDNVAVPTSPNYNSSIGGHVSLSGDPATVTVGAYRDVSAGNSGPLISQATVDSATGNYSITDLPPGSYTVKFGVTSAGYKSEWWKNTWFQDDATRVVVADASATTGVDAELTSSGPPPSIRRIAGSNRFQTSAKIALSFTATGGVVYIANGMGYADALSAAAAAARWDAPLLLTERDYLPDPVRTELLRLKPSRIVVAGGTGVVSERVFDELDALTDGTIDRISGPNRYATSQAIARDAFLALGSAYAIIATGRGFPDALSAAGAANQIHAPVILVDGAQEHLDAATKSLLLSFPYLDKVFIAGGTGVVSAGIESDLNALGLASGTERLGGSNRYETSALINKKFFTAPIDAYFATGLGFPDALAGAALAGHTSGPLYLVKPTCVPPATLGDVSVFPLKRITLLGGTGVLTSSVAALHACS